MKGSRLQQLSISRRLGRRWMVLVAVAVVAVAGFAVYRLNGIFGSADVTSTPSGAANEIVPFNPKHVLMEVLRAAGDRCDHHLHGRECPTAARRRRRAALGVRHDHHPTRGVRQRLAQGDSDSIGCRIKIDDAVKDERSVNTRSAFTYCLDKSG